MKRGYNAARKIKSLLGNTYEGQRRNDPTYIRVDQVSAFDGKSILSFLFVFVCWFFF